VYLRESGHSNKDGSTVSYLHFAHNERHPKPGSPVTKVFDNFGRADKVDKEALIRLVHSISRVLDLTASATSGVAHSGVQVVDWRRLGSVYVLDELWSRLGIGKAHIEAAGGRRLDGAAIERICFALVAQQSLEPGSKLAAVRWAQERVAIPGCPMFDDQAAFAAMDLPLAALPESAERIVSTTANLLNLSCDIISVDTSLIYFELNVADDEVDLEQAGANEVKVPLGPDDLAGWMLNRVVWIADRGFNSVANRVYLQRGGGHFIVAEKLRNASVEAALTPIPFS
jgi:hypothetical protein